VRTSRSFGLEVRHRPRSRSVVAAELLGIDDEVSPELVAEGVALLDRAERTRLVEAYATRIPDIWSVLCSDLTAEVAERELVASAVRAAVNERREPSTLIVALLASERHSRMDRHTRLSCVARLVLRRTWQTEALSQALVALRGSRV
jgi:hypothetical protein